MHENNLHENKEKKTVRITAVSYLNTKPLLYGLLNSDVSRDITLTLDIPSVCAQKLRDGEADLGLIPVAAIPELTTPHIISDYCIGAVGAVKTVCIFSDVPIYEIETLYLDYHSRTSVELAKILLEKYWHVAPRFLKSDDFYLQKLGGTIAGLAIGDKTMGLDKKFRYVYDLGEAWGNYTSGLPFVFAAWVSCKPLSEIFLKKFNAALKAGLNHIPELIYLLPTQENGFDLNEYFTKYISYDFDAQKHKALRRFLSEINSNVVLVG